MTLKSFDLPAAVKGLGLGLGGGGGGGGGARASAADRLYAAEVLFVSAAREALPAPSANLSLNEVLDFYLGSAAFEHWTISAAISRRRPGLDERLESKALAWARKRLPLSAATRTLLSEVDRGQFLTLIFSDFVFLETIYAARPYNWSAGVFLPPVQDDRLRVFVEELTIKRSPLLDPAWLSRWGHAGSTEVDHLIRFGQVPGFKANAIFDAAWYAEAHATGSANYFENLRHYVENGERVGYSPNPFLNIKRYGAIHQDLFAEVIAGRLDSLLEQLISRDTIEQRSSAAHFDARFYSGQVPREKVSRFGSPFGHYLNEGWRTGLQPNPCFDEAWYFTTYPDALAAVREGRHPNGFSHFVLIGEDAGLAPSAFFDPKAYAAANADIAAATTTTPFRHFWQQGRLEVRDFGDPRTAVVARHFSKRLPDSADLATPEGLVRAPADPRSVLERVMGPKASAPMDLVSLIEGVSPWTPEARRALDEALRELGKPRVGIEVGRQQQIHSGDWTRLYVSGLASFAGAGLRAIRANSPWVQGGCRFFRYYRLEEVEATAVFGLDRRELQSGFMAWFEFASDGAAAKTHYVDLEFVFGDPDDPSARIVHETIEVAVHARPHVSESRAKIQVAMASYNAPDAPFQAQVDSILANPGAHLLISDDASPASGVRSLSRYADHKRVDIDFNTVNGGFISNFERSLYMRSPAAEMILFADQDDVWRNDKIKTLKAMLKPGVSCAFSDMRIVTGKGEVISETFWAGRQVHNADPLTLGVANTITGAAAAFPAAFAELLTPFPRYMGVYHDQWLSVLAAATGSVAYTPKPLYDYVQHGANVLGFSGSRSGAEARWAHMARRLRKALRLGRVEPRDLAYVEIALSETIPLLQRFVLLHEALTRAMVWADPDVRRVAQEMSAAIQGKAYSATFLRRSWGRLARQVGGAAGLLNIDDMFQTILLARALVDREIVSPRALKDARDAKYARGKAQQDRERNKSTTFFETKISPIAMRVTDGLSELRINLFLPELQLATFFGGYHSKIALISRLEARGIPTRLVLVDQAEVDYDSVSRIVGAFPELEIGLNRTEIVAMGSRLDRLDLGPKDALVATTWWSADIVDELRRKMGRERFLYFIQEFEPFTFPLGTWYRGAEETYAFPHDAIFSTKILQDFFAHNRIGVFDPSAAPGARALAFRNPITGLKDVARTPVAERRPRLLFYARPQPHAARNMYEFGVAALRIAAEVLGAELDGWDLVGVGASENAEVKLAGDKQLRLISKLDAYGYRKMLASSDVGMALMYTPHPSLVPLEMAAAGLVTVTNGCMSKTQASFADISSLIHVAEPEVEAIAQALVAALRQVNAGHVVNPGLDWPTSPETAFPTPWLDEFIGLAVRSLTVKSPATTGR